MNRLKRTALLLPVLLVVLVVQGWAEDTWKGVERIVAVGDVHGDFGQFEKVLRAAKVIDEKDDWIGGKTHLVQVGDVLDRGPDSRKAMDLLMKLETQAAKAGGAVHPLIGNHEAMVLLGAWHYVSRDEIKAFGGERQYRAAMSAKGKYGRWIRKHNAVIKINDVLFLHAGLTPAYADKSLAEINGAVRAQLALGKERGICMDSHGPLWDRTLAQGDDDKVAPRLDKVFAHFGARHMVVGHTVDTSGVHSKAGGRLFRIDVGMYSGYGGPAACLLIDKGEFYEIRAGAEPKKLEAGERVGAAQ